MAIVTAVVPDIGDFHDVPVIDVLITAGDEVKAESPLCTLESEKATMDVPAPVAGKVVEVLIKVGDKVNTGTPVAKIEALEAPSLSSPSPSDVPTSPSSTSSLKAEVGESTKPEEVPPSSPPSPHDPSPEFSPAELGTKVHATPAVRAYARQLGVDLRYVTPSGPNGRIRKEDVIAFIKTAMTSGIVPGKTPTTVGAAGFMSDLPPWPKVDYAKYGPTEQKPLTRIRKISAANLARNWVMIPAVTYHDEADVTELEGFRRTLNEEYAKQGVKFTLLTFIIKASATALQHFPEINASLDGDQIVLKRYYHIGFAADTPQGLVVPVLKNADQKSLLTIARETAELANKARTGQLTPAEMQGASFTISSLGSLGGTAFSPIINAPEVAILGVSKVQTKPVWNGETFTPRLLLPLSLSADHRLIDGAYATRFLVFLIQLLSDFRRVLL